MSTPTDALLRTYHDALNRRERTEASLASDLLLEHYENFDFDPGQRIKFASLLSRHAAIDNNREW